MSEASKQWTDMCCDVCKELMKRDAQLVYVFPWMKTAVLKHTMDNLCPKCKQLGQIMARMEA